MNSSVVGIIGVVIGVIIGVLGTWFLTRLNKYFFKSLASEALQENNKAFIALANTDLEDRQKAIGTLVGGVNETLNRIETQRNQDYGSLTQMASALKTEQIGLTQETRNLVSAIRGEPQIRGTWGETTLRNVVELCGMVDHCDFYEQESINTTEGVLRPDMRVKLPNQRNIVVDSKTVIKNYYEAMIATKPETQADLLKLHAKAVRLRLNELSDKAYWKALEGSPEFVVQFLPGEQYLSAALKEDPELINDGMKKNIALASPATLFCLLHAVKFGWKEETLTENAEIIEKQGRELYEQLSVWVSHLANIGKYLGSTVDEFNVAAHTLQTKVLKTAKGFKDIGITAAKTIPDLDEIHKAVDQRINE